MSLKKLLALLLICAYLINEGKRRLFLVRHWSCNGKIKRLRVGGWCWGFLLSSSSLPQYISSTLYHTGRFRKLIICNLFIFNVKTFKGEGAGETEEVRIHINVIMSVFETSFIYYIIQGFWPMHDLSKIHIATVCSKESLEPRQLNLCNFVSISFQGTILSSFN